MSDEAVTQWLGALAEGDEAAATQLWSHCFERLVRLARRRLGDTPRRDFDEEDVALSAFRVLCDGVMRHRFDQLSDRHDLWKLLMTLTARKAIDRQRRANGQKRGGGRVRGESVFARDQDEAVPGIDRVAGGDLTPEFLAMLDEQNTMLFDVLGDDTLRRIALWKLEGFTNDEIAGRLELTTRSIERKLQRIRDRWSRLVETPDA
ncbi:MAG: hypothetical protein KDA38_06385 [Planctomycetales bacterium]|nr:hypothetical protein [Planctomycetales bacterium]